MVLETTSSLLSLTEKIHLPTPHFGFIDVDKTMLYDDQNPQDLIQAIDLMSSLGTPDHNLFLTLNTQHLADLPQYQPLWNLRWKIPDKTIISPPIMLEMGLVIGQYDELGRKVDYEFGQHHNINIVKYAKETRPKIIQVIEKTFPSLVTFESGKVLVGAQILPMAIEKYGPNPKNQMKPILETKFKENRLADQAYVISAGKDLDVAPIQAQRTGKRVGFVTFFKKLQATFPNFNLSLPDFLQRFYFADDKGYAGLGLLGPLAILDAGAIIPSNGDKALQEIPGAVHVSKQGPLHVLQAIMEHAINSKS